MKNFRYSFFIGVVFLFPCTNFAAKPGISFNSTASKQVSGEAEPERRAKPAPFDSVFPSTEYPGPTIGVPDTDPIYPVNKMLWKNFKELKKNNIRIYGWVNPSVNASSSKNSNSPLGYMIVPNRLELDQLVLRVERVPDTVQISHIDWGFRLSNLYGIDYRFTTAKGFFSEQLLEHNLLYGYDPVEAYAQVYFPCVARGMVLTIGRYSAPADIESQFAVQNYLASHSIMYTLDTNTQTGINAAIKFNDNWSIQIGLHSGSDVAPWTNAAHPTLLAFVRWVSADNNDSLWGGISSFNDGQFKGDHDNLQQFNLTWSHRFTEKCFTQTELYYIYQYNAARGGTCNFGPIRSFGGGGGCGPIIHGTSASLGAVNFIEVKVSDKDFVSFRTDYLDDYQGQRTKFATAYMSWTLGLTHQFSNLFVVRPEIRYDTAFKFKPYDNGTRSSQKIFVVDAIIRF
jgi:Putative beta-barrel porin-2, OmpL-like. bbp2